jgi:hypothetical protein
MATSGNNSGSHTNVINLELPVNQLVGMAYFVFGSKLLAKNFQTTTYNHLQIKQKRLLDTQNL